MKSSPNITGRYHHYKGGEYQVIGEGTHSETGERLVIYQALYDTERLWARPYDMFFGTVVVDGVETSRFKKVEDDGADSKA